MTYYIGDYVDYRVNGTVHKNVSAIPLDVLVSQSRMSLLFCMRGVRHACVRVSCGEMKRFSCQRVGRFSFSNQCPCLGGETEGT